MKVLAFASACTLSLGVFMMAGAGYFIWNIDREWSPLLEPRLREKNALGSIRVLIDDPSTQQSRWLGSFSGGRQEERQPMKLSEIPPLLIQSIVLLEDPRFLSHEGFDILGIARAFVVNLVSLKYAQGGSTLTQQLVKNVFLTREKTLRRKITELVLAALLEKKFTKDEILEAYINEVYLGQLGSMELHGVGRAAEYYFNKKIDTLELPEMALLAALINSPGLYNPWRNPERALQRRNRALKALLDHQMILQEEFDKADKAPLPGPSQYAAPVRAAYLMDALKDDLLARLGEVKVLQGGFEIALSLDLELQEDAEAALKTISPLWPLGTQGLIVAADPKTCTIKAYVGGSDYRVTQFDRIRQAKRPVGSLIKPLLITELLDKDPSVHLAKIIDDQPLEWRYDHNRGLWRPENYDRKFRGKVSLRRTLEESLNIPFVRVFFEKNPNGLLWDDFEPLRSLGFQTLTQDRALPAALIGSIEESPRNVLTAFLKLVRRSVGVADTAADLDCALSFEKKTAVATPSVEEASLPGQEVDAMHFGQQGARLAIAALEGALRRGTSASLGAKIPLDQPWAGKTGTGTDKRDSWYAALSPDLVILAWVGRDDYGETAYTGATGALPLVSQVLMQNLKKSSAWNWPEVKDLNWRLLKVPELCVASSSLEDKARQLSPAPAQQSTPPPANFEMDGSKYVWELFRAEAEAPRCP